MIGGISKFRACYLYVECRRHGDYGYYEASDGSFPRDYYYVACEIGLVYSIAGKLVGAKRLYSAADIIYSQAVYVGYGDSSYYEGRAGYYGDGSVRAGCVVEGGGAGASRGRQSDY